MTSTTIPNQFLERLSKRVLNMPIKSRENFFIVFLLLTFFKLNGIFSSFCLPTPYKAFLLKILSYGTIPLLNGSDEAK